MPREILAGASLSLSVCVGFPHRGEKTFFHLKCPRKTRPEHRDRGAVDFDLPVYESKIPRVMRENYRARKFQNAKKSLESFTELFSVKLSEIKLQFPQMRVEFKNLVL